MQRHLRAQAAPRRWRWQSGRTRCKRLQSRRPAGCLQRRPAAPGGGRLRQQLPRARRAAGTPAADRWVWPWASWCAVGRSPIADRFVSSCRCRRRWQAAP
jgi:hypothetical protein